MNKVIIGLKESIKIFTNKEPINLEGKIDTGARMSSLDKKIAIENFNIRKQIVDFDKYINSLDLSNINMSEEEKNSKIEIMKKKFLSEDIVDIQFTKSSHGISIRPYINLKIEIKGIKIETLCNLYDRAHMTYPLLIGVNTLKQHFLIDPSL